MLSLQEDNPFAMLTKAQVYDTMNSFPEKFSIDQLIERLLFMEKVEKGMEQSRQGKLNTIDQARQKLSRWLK